MNIRVFNAHGYQIILPLEIKSALNQISLEADIPDANLDEIAQKMLRVLESHNFDVSKLQPEISYFDTKKGRKIAEIRFDYGA